MTAKSHRNEDLESLFSSVKEEIEPNRDLWQGIELSLQQSNKKSSRDREYGHLFLHAASFACVAVLGWLLINTPEQTQPSVVEVLAKQHDEQMQSLLVTFSDEPALTDNWKYQLDELDQAAQAVLIALEQDPDNAALLNMLQNIYQQQIDLVGRVHAPKWEKI